MDCQKLKSLFAEYGLSKVFDRAAHRMRNAVRMEPAHQPDRMIPVGASKLGGLPDLPDSFSWPFHSETNTPLSFVCQINLADVTQYDTEHELPERGMLYLFYDCSMDGMPWGFDPADAPGTAVYYYDGDLTALHRVSAPTALTDSDENGRVFGSASLTFQSATELPAELNIDLTKKELDAYWNMLDNTCENSIFKLLGHADNIQGEMELECELVTNGLYCGNGKAYRSAEAAKLKKTAPQWRLLMQIDSDETLGMEWGDCGRLYVWIRESDLKSQDFNRTWLILQCS